MLLPESQVSHEAGGEEGGKAQKFGTPRAVSVILTLTSKKGENVFYLRVNTVQQDPLKTYP